MRHQRSHMPQLRPDVAKQFFLEKSSCNLSKNPVLMIILILLMKGSTQRLWTLFQVTQLGNQNLNLDVCKLGTHGLLSTQYHLITQRRRDYSLEDYYKQTL